jgi:hypothetical protein
MKAKRIIRDVFVLGVLALFMLALVPGQALAFNPQPEPPARAIQQAPTPGPPPGTPKMAHPPEGPPPGAVLPHFKTKAAPLAPGQAKGFDFFTPSESGKLLPGAPKGIDPGDDEKFLPGTPKMAQPTFGEDPGKSKMAQPTFASPGETKGIDPGDDMPAPVGK